MRSDQKGSLENNHELLRYICPKHADLRALGLVSQDKLNLALSHINSSPLEMTKLMPPDLFERFESFGIVQREQAPRTHHLPCHYVITAMDYVQL